MSRWIVAPETGAAARTRLFCFAHAGGGAALFRPWRDALLPEIEVCPVVLPGRESRLRETPYARMDDLVDPLCEALLRYDDKPFAFFGHSLGAAIAYEAALALAVRSHAGPSALIVSARRAPHRWSKRPPTAALDDAEFLAMVDALNGTPREVVANRELMSVFLPCLRADFTINDTYVRAQMRKLACPVSAYAADRDPEVEPYEVAEWCNVTTAGGRYRLFGGDHFFLGTARPDLLAAIRDDVQIGERVR